MVINKANNIYKDVKIFSFKKIVRDIEKEINPRDQFLIKADCKTKWRVGK